MNSRRLAAAVFLGTLLAACDQLQTQQAKADDVELVDPSPPLTIDEFDRDQRFSVSDLAVEPSCNQEESCHQNQ